jgi:hypothetical protein
MKQKNIIEPRIRRGLAARLLNLHPKTLRIRERQGKLTPIHENSRMVFYLVSEVEKLQRGESATPEPARPLIPAVRTARGQFARVKA